MTKIKIAIGSEFKKPPLVYDIHGLDGDGRVLVYSRLGDPMRNFPAVRYKNKAINVWLYNNILDPLLKRWGAHSLTGNALVCFVKRDVALSIDKAIDVFKVILRDCTLNGETALLATSSVVVSLLRSILTFKDFMLGNRVSIVRPRRGNAKISSLKSFSEFEAEKAWCGLTYYPIGSDYFFAPVQRPANPESLRPNHLDPGYVRNLFRCSNKVITYTCDEAVKTLKRFVSESEEFITSDLGCLLSQSFPIPSAYQENKSGVVRLKKSSM
ncbi:MAG: hypothetical protein WCO38_03665 [Verrucomicrobiota bacterium]|jgi:hypothetical protein|nr:MAG: hypothetical protein DVB35_00820 [Verrucomicrobiota bacterium]